MEPTLPSPHGSPEMGPIIPRGPELGPVQHGQSAEQLQTPEQPAQQERPTGAGVGDTPPPMPVVPLPTQTPAQAAQTTVAHDNTNPVVAADEDLIEKEWIEKAKRVISETKHDPHAQEQAISRLQADYLQKRYGKVLKVPKEE
jgi:uncharacterized protein (DUF4415 family)